LEHASSALRRPGFKTTPERRQAIAKALQNQCDFNNFARRMGGQTDRLIEIALVLLRFGERANHAWRTHFCLARPSAAGTTRFPWLSQNPKTSEVFKIIVLGSRRWQSQGKGVVRSWPGASAPPERSFHRTRALGDLSISNGKPTCSKSHRFNMNSRFQQTRISQLEK